MTTDEQDFIHDYRLQIKTTTVQKTTDYEDYIHDYRLDDYMRDYRLRGL